MAFWTDLEPDVAEIIGLDGEIVEITSGGVTYRVKAMWTDLSLEGGEQGGERIYVAQTDLPSTFTQGDAVAYDGTTYHVTHRAPDGHGFEEVTLVDESTL